MLILSEDVAGCRMIAYNRMGVNGLIGSIETSRRQQPGQVLRLMSRR